MVVLSGGAGNDVVSGGAQNDVFVQVTLESLGYDVLLGEAGDDVFAIQEEVAREVATGIVGRLLPAEARALAVRPTASAEAITASAFTSSTRTVSKKAPLATFLPRERRPEARRLARPSRIRVKAAAVHAIPA